MIKNIGIVIPAYNPDDKLITLVKNLKEKQFMTVVVINNGSEQKCDAIFNSLKSKPPV